MNRLKEWALDWIDRSGTQPSDRKISDPLALLQGVFTTLAALVALASSPAISALAPNMSPAARMGLNILIGLLTLAALHHVITAKHATESISGHRVQSSRTYRFSQAERLVARGVIVLAVGLFALNLIPQPRPCNMTATVTWPDAAVRALYLTLRAGGREERYELEAGRPVALRVAPEHASDFSIALVWSDGSRSDFAGFSACPAAMNRASNDGRARIDLSGR